MVSANHSASDYVARTAFIHREILQLGALILVAVAAFFITRAVAANNRAVNLRDAAEWYRRGQQELAAARIDDAIDAFRRATVRDRTDTQYMLALARTLALKGDDENARSALLTLHDSAPEDPEVNLELARLAAAHQDVAGALRFYHNALYAPWTADHMEARFRVRIELVRFLLAHNQASRALSELLVLIIDLPDDLPHHLEVARLFVNASDSGHALEQFERGLRLDPDNGEALAGAGHAAFQLGQYALARRHFRRAPTQNDDDRNVREVVDLVLAKDPLANRIGSAERRHRLIANVTYARQRLADCMERPGRQPTADELALQTEALAFQDQLKPTMIEQDTIESAVDLVDRVERHVVQSCGPPAPLDQALVLIGRQHGANAQ